MNIGFLVCLGRCMVMSFKDQRNMEENQSEVREEGNKNKILLFFIFDIFFNFLILVKYTNIKQYCDYLKYTVQWY